MHRYACLASLLPLVAAHGFLSSPPGRRPGPAYRATCGEQPFYQQSSDINGNVQGIQQVVGNDMTEDCNLWLCKGFLLEDNPDQVQSYSLGQTIDITVNIAAPHTGYANVSVVKTSTNTMIGNPLIEFQNYASNSGVAANNTAFSVTLPESLGGDCATAGDCVLQWFWDAPDIDQTYEACADFVVAAGSGTSPSAAPTSSSVSATSAVAVTTTSTVPATSVDPAPTETSTAVPGNPGDDECPADDGEEEQDEEEQDEEDEGQGEGDDNGDVECPADEGEGEEEEEVDDTPEDECPADDGEGGDDAAATSTTSLGAKDVSTSAAATATGSPASTITQVITSTVTTERVVTVTAPATACN